MLASLPMYDLPALREATDAWWQALASAFRARGIADVPTSLERSCSRLTHWSSPELLLSQSCGYPLVRGFADHLRLVAVPLYDAPGCQGPRYCSCVMVRETSTATRVADLRGARAAINGRD